MAGVIEVKFDRVLWSTNGTGTTQGKNGLDCFSVWPDKDGATFWAFEWYGSGFARGNFSDGSLVWQDVNFGIPDGQHYINAREDGNALFQQDGVGHYYTQDGDTDYLYKFHINPSPVPSSADITLVTVSNYVVTVACNNSFTPGQYIYIYAAERGLANADFLRDNYVIVNTATSTHFTFDFIAPNYGPTPETAQTLKAIAGTGPLNNNNRNNQGTILNGYELTDGAFDGTTINAYYLEDMKAFISGGVNYLATQDGEFLTIINADTMGISVPGSVTSGTFTYGYPVIQENTGAMSVVLYPPPTGSNPLNLDVINGSPDGSSPWDIAIYTVTGSVTAGKFLGGEYVVQDNTGASANLFGLSPTGSADLGLQFYYGPADNTSDWVSQNFFIDGSVTSGAFQNNIYEQVIQNVTGAYFYAGFAEPTGSQSFTFTGGVTGTPDNVNDWVGQTSGGTFTPTTLPYNARYTPTGYPVPLGSFTPTSTPVVGGLVGQLDGTAPFQTNAYGWQSFVDNSGVLWALYGNGGYNVWADHGTTLYAWNPADGVDGSNSPIVQTRYIPNADTVVQGRNTSGTFIAGEAVVQNSTGASANLVGGLSNSHSQTGPMYLTPITGTPTFADYWVGQDSGAIWTPSITGPMILGSVTSGTFQVNETVTQNSTGATANIFGKVTGNFTLNLGQTISGTADDVNDWVGDISGAVYTPTPQPTSMGGGNTNLAYSAVSTTYIPSTNSVFLTSDLSTATGDACVMSMSTWLRTAYQPDDLMYYVNLDYDESEEGVDIGFQSTQMMVEGSPGTPFQTGGMLNIINPDLTIASSINATEAVILSPNVTVPVQGTSFNHAQVGYISQIDQPSGTQTTVTCTYNNMVVGNTPDFNDIAYATWLGAAGPITAVTATGFSFTATSDHSPWSHSEPAPYSVAYCEGESCLPPLSSYAWNKATNQCAITFNFNGSPVYLIPTAPLLFDPATGGPTTLTVAGGYTGSTSSPPVDLVIEKGNTTTTIFSSDNPGQFGDIITFTIHVANPDGGVVTLTDTFNSVTTTLATLTLDGFNNATYTTGTFAIGNHLLTATYAGDASFNSSVGTLTEVITAQVLQTGLLPSFALIGAYETTGDVTLPSSGNAVAIPSTVSVHESVFVVWNTANIIQVKVTGNNGVDPAVDSGLLNTLGSGTFEIAGGFTENITLTWTAYDSPGHAAIVQVLPVTVSQSGITPTVTVTPSSGSITTNDPLTVVVTVTGGGGNPTPTGSVVLSSGAYTASLALVSGSATFNISPGLLAVGTDTLTAAYSPDTSSSSTYNSGVGSNTVTVSRIKTTPTVTVTPFTSNITTTQSLSVSVNVAGNPTPTGTIVLSSGSYTSSAATLDGSGNATINIPAGTLALGSDTLSAAYTPDTNGAIYYNPSSGTAPVTVVLSTPTAQVKSTTASLPTQTIPVTVTVAGSPTPAGTVTLTSGSYSSGPLTLSGGSASVTIPSATLPLGPNSLSAAYTPGGGSTSIYNSATGSGNVLVTNNLVGCIQFISVNVSSTNNPSIFPLPFPVTAGNTVILAIYLTAASGTPPTISSRVATGYESSATWTMVFSQLSGGAGLYVYVAENCPYGLILPQTSTNTASSGIAMIMECTNLATSSIVDAFTSGLGTSATTTTGSFTPQNQSEYLLSFIGQSGVYVGTSVASPFNLTSLSSSPSYGIAALHTGDVWGVRGTSYAASWTSNSGPTKIAALLALKSGVAAGVSDVVVATGNPAIPSNWVQSKGSTSNSTTSVTFSPISAVTTGNTLVVAVVQVNSVATPTVTDNLGNTYTLQASETTTAGLYLFTSHVTTGGSASITISMTSGTNFSYGFSEYSGVNSVSPVDVVASQAFSNQSVSPTSGLSLTTTATDLIISLAAVLPQATPGLSIPGFGTRVTIENVPDTTYAIMSDTVAPAGTYSIPAYYLVYAGFPVTAVKQIAVALKTTGVTPVYVYPFPLAQ